MSVYYSPASSGLCFGRKASSPVDSSAVKQDERSAAVVRKLILHSKEQIKVWQIISVNAETHPDYLGVIQVADVISLVFKAAHFENF